MNLQDFRKMLDSIPMHEVVWRNKQKKLHEILCKTGVEHQNVAVYDMSETNWKYSHAECKICKRVAE